MIWTKTDEAIASSASIVATAMIVCFKESTFPLERIDGIKTEKIW